MNRNGHRPKVLVSDGGIGQARSTLATVRSLALAGYFPAVTTSGKHSVAAASRFCLRSIEVPLVSDPAYAEAVKAELEEGGYLTFLAAGDKALLAMGADVRRLVDKSQLAEEAERAGLESAPGVVYESVDALIAVRDKLDYPVVIKPTKPQGKVRCFGSPERLMTLQHEAGPVVVQPYLHDRLRAIGGVMFDGRLIASVHQRYLRTWPADCGGASAAETVGADLEAEEALVRLLGSFEGVFQAQFAGDYLLDLNPRVYGSLPLATRAGVNLPGIYCDALRGKVPGSTARAREGVFFRWLEGDLRNVLRGIRTRRLGPVGALNVLRPRAGAAHGPESLKDPKPMFTRLIYAAKTNRRQEDGAGTAG